jgi:subtilisin family serine protease
MPLQEDACNQSPAHAPNAITVAATNVSDGISWFSNFGPCVDLFAPGVGLQSAWLNNTYITLSGMLVLSCFLGVHVSGVLASLLILFWRKHSNTPLLQARQRRVR